ncbi:CCA tRNA nucleotidyltransferase, mitochondrial [Pestalotiopsis sp. IQ-011]
MAEPKTYQIRYARHVLSESNASDNSGVNIHDPPITTPEKEDDLIRNNKLDPMKHGHGREYAETKMREYFLRQEKGVSVFIVSPLARVIQTFLLSAKEDDLRRSLIIIEPLLLEQTRWFSDRARPVKKIRETIEQELQARFHGSLTFQNLNIDWQRMLTGENENEENETLDKPWHLKTGEWAPENLIERGKQAVQMILQECKKIEKKQGQYVDNQVCVFGHGGFVNYMTDQVGATDTRLKVPKLSDWYTGEIRDYKVYDANPGDPSPCRLLVRSEEEPLVGKGKEVEDDKRMELREFVNVGLDRYTPTPDQENAFNQNLARK